MFAKLVVFIVFPLTIVSCSVEKDEETKEEKERKELLATEKRLKKEARELELAKKKELQKAEQLAEEEAMQAKLLEEELLKKQQEEEQRVAEEKERLRLEEIAKRQEVQEVAIEEYLGTKYEELKLENGRVLKSVKVTSANPIGVSFMHSGGVARVEYSELPSEIREACMYDEELATIAVEREQAMKVERQKAMIARSKLKKENDVKKASSTTRSTASRSKVEAKEPEKEVRPRGILSVRVVGSARLGKRVEMRAKTNVNASITLDGVYEYGVYVTKTYSVPAKKSFSIVVSNVKSKYIATLNGGGKILDQESSGSKSGLRERKGL